MFQFNREELASVLELRNETLHKKRQLHENDPEYATIETELKQLNKCVKEKVSMAKARWYAHLCEHIHDMSMNPRKAWEYIRILTKGETAHHRMAKDMALRRANGKIATNDNKNMERAYPHFQEVLNNHRPVDFSVLEPLQQSNAKHELDAAITWDEFNKAVNKLKTTKPLV